MSNSHRMLILPQFSLKFLCNPPLHPRFSVESRQFPPSPKIFYGNSPDFPHLPSICYGIPPISPPSLYFLWNPMISPLCPWFPLGFLMICCWNILSRKFLHIYWNQKYLDWFCPYIIHSWNLNISRFSGLHYNVWLELDHFWTSQFTDLQVFLPDLLDSQIYMYLLVGMEIIPYYS